MNVTAPQLPALLEEGIPLEEALAMTGADEAPLEAFSFRGGSAAGAGLKRASCLPAAFPTAASRAPRCRKATCGTACSSSATFPARAF